MSHKGHISNILDTVSPPHARAEWDYEHITTPRPSCIPLARTRLKLRNILPGRGIYFGDTLVKRMGSIKHVGKFEVDGRKYLTESQVLAIVSAASEQEAA